MTSTVIEIDRIPLTFVTAAASERAELVWRRARDALVRTLPSELGAAWGSRGDNDDSYVFLDRVDVACAIGSDWPEHVMASAFAERVAREMERAFAGTHALVFRDRAEYLSSFLAASIDGDPFGAWWFSDLDGLRLLTTSARIRTLVVTEGQTGWEALARLTPQLLSRVVGSLDDTDAGVLLTAVERLPPGPTGPSTSILEAVARAAAASVASPAHRVVLGLVELFRDGVDGLRVETAAAVAGLLVVIDAARRGRLGQPTSAAAATVLEWCRETDLARAQRAAVMALDAAAVVEFVAARMPEGSVPDGAGSPEASAAFGFTPFGGALLLAVVLCRSERWVRWRDVLRATSVAERADPLAAALALGVVARALDPRQVSLIERDSVIRRVFGLGPIGTKSRERPETRAALAEALAAGEGDHEVGRPRSLAAQLHASARHLLAELARSVPGCEGSSPAYLRTRLLTLPAAVSADGPEARLGRAPLDILLGLSGLKRASVVLPDGRRLVLSEEPSW